MKPLLLIVFLLSACHSSVAAEPLSGNPEWLRTPPAPLFTEKEEVKATQDAPYRYTTEELDAMKKAAKSQRMAPSGDTTTKRRYTTEELDAREKAEQSRNAAEKQRLQLAKDNYACLLEYRRSGPAIQAPSVGGGNELAAMLQVESERRREEKYVQACMESKGWIFPARNAESTK